MSFNEISPGKNPPENCNMVVEISACDRPVKYEVCKDNNQLTVDRFLQTSMVYPCNYGYIPKTLCDDGDPLDVLVITPFAVQAGAVIAVRPIGMLAMTDEAGLDHKLLAVPVAKLTPMYNHIKTVSDLPTSMLQTIEHFFQHYKDLEDGKWVKVDGWEQVEAAQKAVINAIKAYDEANN